MCFLLSLIREKKGVSVHVFYNGINGVTEKLGSKVRNLHKKRLPSIISNLFLLIIMIQCRISEED